ncbi:MAG: hypothetical protein COA65_00960 [Rhodospirillaceae bacterium]|nr:MAG: hypothetical protein COA65_00960 [Rhodospirillaceae bacterium]
MSKLIPLAICAGLLSALLYVSIVTGRQEAFFLTFFTQLPLLLVGFGIGYPAVKIAAAAGVGAVVLLGGIYYGVAFLLLNVGPAVLLVRQTLLKRTHGEGRVEWYPLGHLVGWVTGIAVFMFLALFAMLAGSEHGVEATVSLFLSEALAVFSESATPAVTNTLEWIAPFFPAFIIGSWLLLLVLNGALAQGLLTRFRQNIRPSPDFAKMALPGWLTYAIAGTTLVFFVAGPGTLEFFSRNLVLILCIPFFLLGLAVIHTFAKTAAKPSWVLVPFYSLLILFGGFAAMVVTGFGFVEQTVGIRRRIARYQEG